MPNHVKKLSLATDEKEFLTQLLRQSTLEARKYLRAKILLSKDRGLSNEKIADRLDITVPTVYSSNGSALYRKIREWRRGKRIGRYQRPWQEKRDIRF